MSKAAAALPSPLVAEGLAIIERQKSKVIEIEAKQKELDELKLQAKGLADELDVVEGKLIAEGPGRYENDAHRVATVVGAIDGTKQADKYELPEGAEARAKEICGTHFKTFFKPITVYVASQGLGDFADKFLTPKPARELVQLCLVEGSVKGAKAAHVRWPK